MENKRFRIMFIRNVLALMLLGLAACGAQASPPAPLPGSDRDEHGCIHSAGYSWCAREKSCVRAWELAKERGFASSGQAFETYCSSLTVLIGPPVHYASPNGDRFVAKYGSLSDGSLSFVKLVMPGGREYTLPQAVSASGVRYTDERELVWWTHQDTVRVDIRDAQGNWITRYPALREIPPNK